MTDCRKRSAPQSAQIGAICHTIVHRRRAACAAAILSTIRQRVPRGPSIARHTFTFPSFIRSISDQFFKRLYRMTKDSFFKLAAMIAHRPSRTATDNRGRPPGSPILRLSITIRWLAGGSYLDIALSHGQPVSSVYRFIEETLEDLDSVLILRFPYKDRSFLQKSSYGFTRGGTRPLRGCCAALDGIAVKITEPSMKDVPNTSTYYNRKGFHALNVQALCDSSYRILFVSAITPGSSHDSTAFSMSSLATLLSRTADTLLDGYWIADDEAYSCTNKVVCPWSGRNLPQDKACFNYWQSSALIFIEQTFGILVARWGIMGRKIETKVSKAADIVLVCCKLHNLILDNEGTFPVPSPSSADAQFHLERADMAVYLQDECDREYDLHRRRRDLEFSNVRSFFTDSIRGLQRPDA